jgi:protoporphyrinogen oxidase
MREDHPTFELLKDLGIADKLHWRSTSMGFFYAGRLNPWGDPVSLLSLPRTSLLTKLRYGSFVFACTHRKSSPALDKKSAKEWIVRWCEESGYKQFWRSLLEYKFYEDADKISAAWIATRIRRVGLSRKNIMQEEMGYLDGGSETLVRALVEKIESGGGRFHFNSPVTRVSVAENRVQSVESDGASYPADFVISTMPVPLIPPLVPDLPESWKAKYRAVKNIGICCVVLKLKRSVSPHFWINIEDENIVIPGVIEFTNLREIGTTIVYVPYYTPVTNPMFSWSDQELMRDAMQCLRKLNHALTPEDLLDCHVARLRHAQPVCVIGFASMLPPVQTPIRGLQIADTCFYYPEDRCISESVRLGRSMARQVR